MDTVEMKAFHMMENREDVAVARAAAGLSCRCNYDMDSTRNG